MSWCHRHILHRAYGPTTAPSPSVAAHHVFSPTPCPVDGSCLSLPRSGSALPHVLIPLLPRREGCAPGHSLSSPPSAPPPLPGSAGSCAGLHTALSTCRTFFLATLLGNSSHPSAPVLPMSIASTQQQLLEAQMTGVKGPVSMWRSEERMSLTCRCLLCSLAPA